jgi:manganese/zinc/iron transport system permease protein
VTSDAIEIQALAAVTAVACALPGVFLVLRRMAMMADAISHVLLLGIVVAFLLVRDLHSPLLLVGAGLSGVGIAALVELLQRTKLVREDAAIGLVFPALFSLGVILVSLKTRNIHLDVDAVLLGEIAYAPFRRFYFGPFRPLHIGSFSLPQSLVLMTPVLIANVALLSLFYKELKLATFDAALAKSLGFMPALLHYLLMTVVSETAVTAFDAVGMVLVVALMVVPAATAYLLTDRLTHMLILSAVIAVIASVAGYWLAHWADANIAGSMTTALGAIFGAVFLFAPQRGLLAAALRRHRQRRQFLQTMLTIHLLNHEGTPEQAEESRLDGLHEHLRWPATQVERVVRWAKSGGLVEQQGEQLALTATGRDRARRLFER